MLKKKDPKPPAAEQPAQTETPAPEELLRFDKRLQQREKPKKQGFGQKKPAKEEPKPEEAATPPAGTFFKVPKPEKKSSFGQKKSGFGPKR